MKKRDRRSECPTCHRGARPVMMEARTASAYHSLRWLVIRAIDVYSWEQLRKAAGQPRGIRSRVVDLVRVLHHVRRYGGWELKLVRVRR